jgi:hypothetical protein
MARLCPCCGCDKSDDAWSDLGKIPSGSPVEAIRHSLAVWEEAAKAGCQVCDAVCQVVGAATARHQQVFADCIALKAHGPPPWTLEISASVRADGWRDIEPRIWLYNLPGMHPLARAGRDGPDIWLAAEHSGRESDCWSCTVPESKCLD